jgi:large conductance mechanosensitive channel
MRKEFEDFAMRGTVMDLAVGIVIGGAFGMIIASFVGDVLMPPIGTLLGGLDVSNLYVSLSGIVVVATIPDQGERSALSFDSVDLHRAAGLAKLDFPLHLSLRVVVPLRWQHTDAIPPRSGLARP